MQTLNDFIRAVMRCVKIRVANEHYPKEERVFTEPLTDAQIIAYGEHRIVSLDYDTEQDTAYIVLRTPRRTMLDAFYETYPDSIRRNGHERICPDTINSEWEPLCKNEIKAECCKECWSREV